MASHSIVVGQLFILREDRRRLGKACAATMLVGAMGITTLGAVRYFNQHWALADNTKLTSGRAISERRNVLIAGAIFAVVCVGLFIVVLVVA